MKRVGCVCPLQNDDAAGPVQNSGVLIDGLLLCQNIGKPNQRWITPGNAGSLLLCRAVNDLGMVAGHSPTDIRRFKQSLLINR
jgi:hypothetical protein